MYSLFELNADGTRFGNPITFTQDCPVGMKRPEVWGLDDSTGEWFYVGGKLSGGQVTWQGNIATIYGIAEAPAPTNTPASSDWSLALLGVAGVAVAGFMVKRSRLS